jgi:CheY-like chemotaxis protein
MGNLSIAQEEAEPHSAMAELLHEIEQASHKARDLTHQFLTLSQGGYPKKERGSIESLLKAIQGQAQAHEGIEYTLSIQDDLWPVEFDSRQMHYAISNVLINAVEAMPQGGKIAIETENQIIEDRSKDSASPLKEGKYVRISIKDEGGGIPEKHLNRIFDPYFSTKERGVKKGMGLGLAAAYAIVEKHGGHIKVNSTIGVGTTVTIYLPAECAETPGEIGSPLHGAGKAPDAKRDGVGVQSTIANQQSPTQRVLVMDDEESLRNLAQKMLERLGYEVETVKDGSDAIETYKKQMDSGEPFDGVILDLTIKGGMGGAQAIKELIKLDPDVKAIVCSGYFNDPVLANFEEYGFGGALAKPYQKADLESVLKTIL